MVNTDNVNSVQENTFFILIEGVWFWYYYRAASSDETSMEFCRYVVFDIGRENVRVMQFRLSHLFFLPCVSLLLPWLDCVVLYQEN